MKLVLLMLLISMLGGCATVDGMRTDVGNGINKVGDWVKPCTGNGCKDGR
jgi:hypothetical protein